MPAYYAGLIGQSLQSQDGKASAGDTSSASIQGKNTEGKPLFVAGRVFRGSLLLSVRRDRSDPSALRSQQRKIPFSRGAERGLGISPLPWNGWQAGDALFRGDRLFLGDCHAILRVLSPVSVPMDGEEASQGFRKDLRKDGAETAKEHSDPLYKT